MRAPDTLAPLLPPKPPSPRGVYVQIEEQARQIEILRERLNDAYGRLGAAREHLVAPGIGDQRPDGYGPVASADDPERRTEAWWPTEPNDVPPLRPCTGRRCAGLAEHAVPVVLVSVCGRERETVASIAAEVAEAQARTRDFIPLFLTDRAHDLDLFRHRGFDVELLPTPADLDRCPCGLPAEEYERQRLRFIREHWAVTRLIDLGARRLPEVPWQREADAARPRIVFYKDYRRHNPYQRLLYDSLPGFTAVPGDVGAALGLLETEGDRAPTIFHLNWEEAVYRGATTEAEAEAEAEAAAFLVDLDRFLAGGGRLLWTVHNTAPHDNAFAAVYDRLADGIAARAGLVHVHSATAAAFVRERYGLGDERVVVAPHGNYLGLYRRPADGKERQRHGLPADRRVFGFVGNVRPYKGCDDLIAAFAAMPRGVAALLVAGRQDPPLALDLAPKVLAEIRLRDETLADAELPSLFEACDVAVFPYRRVLSSGSLILAMGLGRPVIVPDLPSLREIVQPGENGFTFRPGDVNDLRATMERARTLPAKRLKLMGEAAEATAKRLDWGWIGRRLGGEVRRRLLGDPPVMPDQGFAVAEARRR